MRGDGGRWWEGERSVRRGGKRSIRGGGVRGGGGRGERLTLFGDRPTRLPMNSTKQPNTAELLMKPVKTSPGWIEHKQRQQSHDSYPIDTAVSRRRTKQTADIH